MKSIPLIILLLTLSLNAQNQNDSVMISLQRTLCYGECPAYSVTIWGDGKVEFNGREFVNTIGLKTYTISRNSVDSLVREIFAIDFFSFNDSYITQRTLSHLPDGRVDTVITQVTDLPTQYVTVKIGTQKKTVEDYYGTPKAIRELENKIDSVAKTSQWVKRK